MADATFDGDNLIMTLPDQDIVDIEADLYSGWKRWKLLGDNLRYEAAFRLITSEDLIVGVLESGAYFRFQNQLGWRVKPYPRTRVVNLVNGSFALENSDFPSALPPGGGFSVMVLGIPPVTQRADIGAQVIENDGVNDITMKQSLQAIMATTVLKATDIGTATEKFRNAADTKDRVTVSLDGSNNRLTVVLDFD